jgi:hypothetical protein
MLRDECVSIAAQIAWLEEKERSGPLAELRRLGRRDDGPPPETFWWLVERAKISGWTEEFWEALVPMMVTCPHRWKQFAGHTLSEAGVAPSRVERWLRMGSSTARVELRKLLRRIDHVDWVRLSALLYHWDDPNVGPRLKRELARDFYLHNSKRPRRSSSQPRP